MELQIDTSTRYASVGLSAEGRALIEITWRSERNHSVELAPAINRMLTQARLSIKDLDAVFVADGPGAFSALRVGMSTAKAIAATLSIPLVTVGTLELEARPFRGLGWPLVAIASAGRNRLYVAGPDGVAAMVATLDEFLETVSLGVLYCGEAAHELADQIEARVGPNALIYRTPPPTRTGSSMAAVGYEKLVGGDTADATTAEPLYLRSSQVASAKRIWSTRR